MTDPATLSETDHRQATGGRLRDAIDAAGLTYIRAAAIMGITKHVLNHWMVGNNPPHVYGLYRLHRATGITPNWVILGDFSSLPHRLAVHLSEAAPQEGLPP